MWSVITTHQFDTWLSGLNNSQQEKVLAGLLMIQHLGPSAGRPYVDTDKGSKYRNMKELRLQASGRALRVFFAFNPKRQAVILCGGDKGRDEKRFYVTQIHLADFLFGQY